MLTKSKLREIITTNYDVAKKIFKEEEERLLNMDSDFNDFFDNMRQNCNELYTFYADLNYSRCVEKIHSPPRIDLCSFFDFHCVRYSKDDKYAFTCPRCERQDQRLYKSICFLHKDERKTGLCEHCLFLLHDMDFYRHQISIEEYNLFFDNFRDHMKRELKKIWFQYHRFKDIPLYSRLAQKLIADKEYFKHLYDIKNYGYLVFKDNDDNVYHPKKIYVVDFDVLSTLIFCLEKRCLSSFLIL